MLSLEVVVAEVGSKSTDENDGVEAETHGGLVGLGVGVGGGGAGGSAPGLGVTGLEGLLLDAVD